MSLKKLNQKGFTPVEVVLVVVLIALIGGAGYYVHNQNDKDKNNKNVKTVNVQESASKTDDNGDSGSGDSHAQTGPSAKDEVFSIDEWKVSAEFPRPPENAALIQYKVAAVNGSQSVARFTTQELIDAGGSACAASNAPAGLIVRAKPGDTFYFDDGTSSGKTVTQELASGSFTPHKQVGAYDYWYEHSQAACGNISKTAPLQSAAADQVKQIVSHLEQE